MERRNFIAGLTGIGLAFPVSGAFAVIDDKKINGSCVLIPSETPGPFPLDLTTNSFYFRQDVRETRAGVQLNLKLRVIGNENCEPMPNLRINIWHCDKDGKYSGYDVQGNPGQAGQTYFRGYQITDVNGEVEFITILPGWYNGRVCHIHFQVYVSSSYAAISQLTFEPVTKNKIFAENTAIYTKGIDPLEISSDGVFSDGYEYQLANLTPNNLTGGYNSFMEVVVKGQGTLGVGYSEKETAKYMTLGQNYPNPYFNKTTIPFTLRTESKVKLELWDLAGRRLKTIDKGYMPAGEHLIQIELNSLGLAQSSYVYQLEIENTNGIYKDCKLMTIGK